MSYAVKTMGRRLDGKYGVTGIIGGLEPLFLLTQIHHAKGLHDSIEIRAEAYSGASFDQGMTITKDEAIALGRGDAERNPFVRSYLKCALWASTDPARDDGGDPLDKQYGVKDIAPDTLCEMVAEAVAFLIDHRALLAAEYEDDLGEYDRRLEMAGRDFWLTRNRHGAGFWDGDWPDEIGRVLTEASHVWGCYTLYPEDGQIHGM